MSWDYSTFGRWLRTARVMRLPVISQEQLAEKIGVSQARVSRWEREQKGTDAPTLSECGRLADIFDVDFIELAKLCGQWDQEIQDRILVNLASGSDLSQAPVAQVDRELTAA